MTDRQGGGLEEEHCSSYPELPEPDPRGRSSARPLSRIREQGSLGTNYEARCSPATRIRFPVACLPGGGVVSFPLLPCFSFSVRSFQQDLPSPNHDRREDDSRSHNFIFAPTLHECAQQAGDI